MLCGVKTVCPSGSLLFLLGVNPVIDLFLMCCDGPQLSVTRVCADDIGSALRRLETLKKQASIFKVADKVCGLKLKPVKCVLIFSAFDLTAEFVVAVREWLRVNIPAFAHFDIACSGKYLGWHLGRAGDTLSFTDPFLKYQKR